MRTVAASAGASTTTGRGFQQTGRRARRWRVTDPGRRFARERGHAGTRAARSPVGANRSVIVESLTRITVAGDRPRRRSVCEVEPDEIRVPPVNVDCHGLVGNVGAKPAPLLRQREVTDERQQVCGGSAGRHRLVGLFEATRPNRCPLRASAASVPPICENVSDEMLAERSSTSTVCALEGSGTIVRVCGARDTSTAATAAPMQTRASAPRTTRVRRAGECSAGASARGIRLMRRPRSRGDLALDVADERCERVALRGTLRPGEVARRPGEPAVAGVEQPGKEAERAAPVRLRPLLGLMGESQCASKLIFGAAAPRRRVSRSTW